MKTYIETLDQMLSNIEEGLCDFISTVELREFRNDPNSGVFVLAHPFYYNTEISDEQKRVQIELKKQYQDWEEHFTLLTFNMPKDIAKDIEESQKFIKRHLELESDWGTEGTSIENIQQIKTRIAALRNVLKLFEKKTDTVLIPDTNALIHDQEFESYVKIAGDKITIILLPTVLQELDRLKVIHRDEQFRKKVMSLIDRIKGLRKQGSLLDGVTVHKTIVIKMIAREPNFDHALSWLDSTNNDDRIIASILEHCRDKPSDTAIVVTSDINLQNKLEMAKIPFTEPPSKL